MDTIRKLINLGEMPVAGEGATQCFVFKVCAFWQSPTYIAAGQNQWYHFGVGAPPILVYFSWDWDVHRGYGLSTHGQMSMCEHRRFPKIAVRLSQPLLAQPEKCSETSRNAPNDTKTSSRNCLVWNWCLVFVVWRDCVFVCLLVLSLCVCVFACCVIVFVCWCWFFF